MVCGLFWVIYINKGRGGRLPNLSLPGLLCLAGSSADYDLSLDLELMCGSRFGIAPAMPSQ